MSRFLQIAEGVEVSAANAQIAEHPELWDQFSLRRTAPGTPHKGMSDIWVRYNDVRPFMAAGDFSRFNDEHVPIWYPAWHALPALRPLVLGLIPHVEGEMLGGVLITRIPPKSCIEPHVDRGWHVDYFDKFYLSLQSAPGAAFHTEGESIEPRPGDMYRFDNRLRHWVTNDSGQDRVTLIICIRTERFDPHPPIRF